MEIHAIDCASPWYEAAFDLRNRVLRHPLGLALTGADRAADATREHMVAVEGGRVIGSVSLYLEEPMLLRVKQMAVDPAAQGQGIGAALMQAAERHGIKLGATRVKLHARRSAEHFYGKQDYAVLGEEFAEQGIPHVIMVKRMEKSLA